MNRDMSRDMSRDTSRDMRWLLRAYPRWWRERYGAEFAELVAAIGGERSRIALALDLTRGALDAHFLRRPDMRRVLHDPAVRRGLYDGLLIVALTSVVVVLTNVVFPKDPDESDGDPEYMVQWFAAVAILAMLLILVGWRGRRRSTDLLGGIKAGATAGVVIAIGLTVDFLAVNNIFLDIVSRQHDKRVAFAASGWSSMRAYLTVTQLGGGVILIVVLASLGALLGLIGGAVVRRRDPDGLPGRFTPPQSDPAA
jgi:hypothetical protein